MLALSFLLTLAVISPQAYGAGSQFSSCATRARINSNFGFNAISGANSRLQCQLLASGQGYPTSFFQPSTNTCSGSQYAFTASYGVAGVDAFGDCQPADFQVTESPTRPSFFQGCYDSFGPGAPYALVPVGFAFVTSCYNYCANPGGSVVAPAQQYASYNPATGSCACFGPVGGGNDPVSESQAGGSYTTCDPSTAQYVYYSGQGSSNPSIYRKRAERIRDLQARRLSNSLCPSSMSPCAVQGARDNDSFECIDTASELESCGGCVTRDLAGLASYAGQNCMEMEGVALGGVTCDEGQCIALACETGYSLHGTTCREL